MATTSMAGISTNYVDPQLSQLITKYLQNDTNIGEVIGALKKKGVPPYLIQLEVDTWYAEAIAQNFFLSRTDALRAYKNANALLCAFELTVVGNQDARVVALLGSAKN